MKIWCESCSGIGYNEYPDYDWDENLLAEGIREICDECQGRGYIDSGYKERNTLERMAMYILKLDIDEDICKKVNCRLDEYDEYIDETQQYEHDCVDCIVDFFSKDCQWNYDDVCVNDKSAWCADFVDNIKCGRCEYFEKSR